MERLTEDLMNSWTEGGHDVVCYTTPPPSGAHFERSDVVIRALPGRSGHYSAGWRRRVRQTVRPEDHDVILGVSSGAASLAGHAGRTPVVMQAHGTALAEIRTKLAGPTARGLAGVAKNCINLASDLRTYRRYDGLVAIGRGVASDLQSVPRPVRPRDVQVIVNGVPSFIEPGVERAHGDTEHVVFVGRLKREKGVDLLLRAAQARAWRVSVAGDGPEEQGLRALAGQLDLEHRVEFLGSVSRDEVGALMTTADVVVVPSRRREGLPLVALEALVLGRRLVVSEQAAQSIPAGHGLVKTARATAEDLGAAVDEVLSQPVPAPEPAFRIEECAASYIKYFERLRRKQAAR
ncbi:glycosyltransferase family 4 protein [Amnibacterium endophyticum]|uniref:Glycosyltransferase family 4 protein n=1 Tax=Amnibacterium endophyticum TaxID=2109337 RepID=A0ABW4LC20_9MICO